MPSPRPIGATFGASLAFALAVSSLIGCSGDKSSNEPNADSVVSAMHDSLLGEIKNLKNAAFAMQAAAPAAADRGWDATQDQAALDATKAAWKDARTAYEHTEGALAPIFPDIDYSIDARYDDYLAELPDGDTDLFDDMGVTGLHGAERILYADVIPEKVVTFESTLTGYEPASFPTTAGQANEFKTLLLNKIITDATTLETQWTPAKIDLNGAFGGLVSLMNEQREKVNKAATGEEESRYSQRTMTDIRDNLAGTKTIYAIFSPWLKTKTNASDPTLDGPTVDAAIQAGFAKLDTLYSQVQGEAIPQPPDSWSSENPSAADLDSDFGKLYSGVQAAVSMDSRDSVVVQMNYAATILGFMQFTE
ncbi:MAG TPA: imelysin family protein [Polyangiaceae bacterium]|nr:imelysin family protein [Polyangiaceae bacterium]